MPFRCGLKQGKGIALTTILSLGLVFVTEVGIPIIENVLDGYNSTIFAYGQTGAGKTHTMIGLADETSMGMSDKVRLPTCQGFFLGFWHGNDYLLQPFMSFLLLHVSVWVVL